MNIRHAGGSPTDSSINPLVLSAPNVLLQTIPLNPARCSVEVQNQSAVTIYVIRDDGNSNSTASTIALGSGGTVGSQGSSWSSVVFKGRLTIWGPTGSTISAFQD